MLRLFRGSLKISANAVVLMALVLGSYSGSCLGYDKCFNEKLANPVLGTKLEIERGENIQNIAKLLHKKGLIYHWFPYLIYSRVKGSDVKAGKFTFNEALDFSQLSEKLSTPEYIYDEEETYRLTFKEGFNKKEIHSILNEALRLAVPLTPIQVEQSLTKVLEDNRNLLGSEISDIEGLLAPETFFWGERERKNISKSLPKLLNKMLQLRYNQLRELPPSAEENFLTASFDIDGYKGKSTTLSGYEVLTLASIVEKETTPHEHPLVASVFINRLILNYRLQSDPTVIYGIADFNGNLTKMDLQTPNPYNTYTQHGLTPTPICNPSLESILKTLNPAKTKYLYFVARRGGGGHIFSENLKAHNIAVYHNQKKRS